jgi:hypothetical protein
MKPECTALTSMDEVQNLHKRANLHSWKTQSSLEFVSLAKFADYNQNFVAL